MNKFILCLMLTLLSPLVWAEIEVITLQHRSVDEVLPTIRPMLDPDGAASGMNNQLILRTSPRNLVEIKQMLQSIDSAPRRLKITVLQNVDRETISRLTEISGSVGLGRDARVTVPPGARSSGLNLEARQDGNRLRARVDSTRSLEDDRKTQQIQVLEGNRAFIQAGQSVPVPQRQIVQLPYGTRVIDSTEYRDVSSGFYVLPRVHGDRVTLEISTQNDSLQSDDQSYPAQRTQRAATTLSGKLGEWLVVGDIGQKQESGDTSISSRSTSSSSEQRSVLLKVEEVK
jgi:type II secretory pathway component GspD/PulD (secretin)